MLYARTRNTTRSWWIALDTMKELENCLQKLERGVSRKRRKWAKQQKAEVNKLNLRSQLGRTWVKLLLEYFENEMSQPSSAQLLMGNPFTRTERQFFFTWLLAGIALEDLNSCDTLKFADKTCMCTGLWCNMLLHAALESTPEPRAKIQKWSSWEGIHEEDCSFLVDSPGYDGKARELSKEAAPRSIQKAPKLGQAAESRGE